MCDSARTEHTTDEVVRRPVMKSVTQKLPLEPLEAVDTFAAALRTAHTQQAADGSATACAFGSVFRTSSHLSLDCVKLLRPDFLRPRAGAVGFTVPTKLEACASRPGRTLVSDQRFELSVRGRYYQTRG